MKQKKITITVNYKIHVIETLGSGPLKTTVYKGTFGPSSSNKVTKKDVVIKKIEARLIVHNMDWSPFQNLNHPNLSSYIYMTSRRINWKKLFLPRTIYIIQDYQGHGETLEDLVKNNIECETLKILISDVSEGLKYLHNRDLIHKNLKPTNILVKSDSVGFVLTDFEYTKARGRPAKMLCGIKLPWSDAELHNRDITKWLAPEQISERDNLNYDIDIGSYTDIYTLGNIVKYVLESTINVDEVDRLLIRLLIGQMMDDEAELRITIDEILQRHPLITIRPVEPGLMYDSRLDYIKDMYHKKRKVDNFLPAQINAMTDEVTSSFMPWIQTEFGKQIFTHMTNKTTKYTPASSFCNLLRLIRNLKEHPLEGSAAKTKSLTEKIKQDAFSETYPLIIPILYSISDETSRSHRIGILSEILKY